MFFRKQKFDVKQLKLNKFIFDVKQLKINKFTFDVKQLKMNRFIKSISDLIISTSNAYTWGTLVTTLVSFFYTITTNPGEKTLAVALMLLWEVTVEQKQRTSQNLYFVSPVKVHRQNQFWSMWRWQSSPFERYPRREKG